jgi:hypothetical protein
MNPITHFKENRMKKLTVILLLLKIIQQCQEAQLFKKKLHGQPSCL